MKQPAYVLNLMRFSLRTNPLLYLSVAISLVSAFIELLAMSSLLPLFELVSGGATTGHGIVARMVAALGFSVNSTSLLWAFVSLFSLRIFTQLLGQSLSLYLGKRVMAQLCSGAFDRIVHQVSIREVNKNSIGYYISLAGDESFRASILVLSITQFISTAALAILYYAAIAAYSVKAALFVLVFMLCALAVVLRVAKSSQHLGGQQTEASRRAGTLFLDSLNNIKTVRAFSAEKYVFAIHRSLMFAYSRILFWIDELSLLTRLVPVLLLFFLFAIVLVWNNKKIEDIGIAFVVTMIVYLMRFFPTVGQGVTLLMRIAADAKTGRDVTEMVGSAPTASLSGARAMDRVSMIELRDVCFSYSDHGTKAVLNHVDIVFHRGVSYAIIGPSGAGKSTLADILLKFYKPTSGELFYNGFLASEVPDSEIRKKVILVGQEPAIFDDTVRNNICLGMVASLEQVRSACKLACIDDIIESMAEGYETRLQYQGSNLSGGQRQRIAIARAMLRAPDVLIVDEGTSALDKETQSRVIQNILDEMADKILILITHDPKLSECVKLIVDLEDINAGAVA
jgi:ABC-type bacteriocin/lantibiotic exporter with double-glycine peptidase domain